MTNKLPTISIKGKDYVMVKDRILAFNEEFKNGSIVTEIVSPLDAKTMVVKATVTPDVGTPTRIFVDYSQAVIGGAGVNMTSALENASTSAVGRALAYMGIGVIESIASADEVNKAITAEKVQPTQDVDTIECLHETFKIVQVQKEGPNKGKYFKSCENCKKFLGWSEKKANEDDWYGEIH